jgi:hypothetical protein
LAVAEVEDRCEVGGVRLVRWRQGNVSMLVFNLSEALTMGGCRRLGVAGDWWQAGGGWDWRGGVTGEALR